MKYNTEDFKNKIKDLYQNKDFSTREVACCLQCCRGTIKRYMKFWNIPIRSLAESRKIGVKKTIKRKGYSYRIKTPAGYIEIRRPEHPRGKNRKYVAEHILIWEQFNHKYLPLNYVIHHLNGIKDDNRIENLVALPIKEHHVHLLNQELQKRIKLLENKLISYEKQNI
jgi:hypothetical protein